jgi:hypothetical protein
VVDLATWPAARAELLVREKAHTRAGDALAAARRRLPMVALDGMVEVVEPGGPVRFLELCQGREELVADQHMWDDGASPGPVRGRHPTAWHLKDAICRNPRGVSLAILPPAGGRRWPPRSRSWAPPALVSVRDVAAPVGSMGGSPGSCATATGGS